MEDIKNVVDYDVIGEEAHPRLVAITLMEYRRLVSDVARLQAELDHKTREYNRLWSENNMLKNKAEVVKNQMRQYQICPMCKCTLDHGERCDCEQSGSET